MTADSRSKAQSELREVGDRLERFSVRFSAHIGHRDEIVKGGFLSGLTHRLDQAKEIASWKAAGWTVESVPNPEMRQYVRSFDTIGEAQAAANVVWEAIGCNANRLQIVRHFREVVIEEGEAVVSTYGPVHEYAR